MSSQPMQCNLVKENEGLVGLIALSKGLVDFMA